MVVVMVCVFWFWFAMLCSVMMIRSAAGGGVSLQPPSDDMSQAMVFVFWFAFAMSTDGKSYDVVSSAAQEPKAMVFLSSAAESKIVGKITRRVSFVHYMEPSEVPKDDTKKLKQLYERSSATSLTNSAYNFTTPTKTKRPGSLSGRTSTHSSGRKSALSEDKMPSRSGQDSGRGSEHSEEKKAKKRKKHVA